MHTFLSKFASVVSGVLCGFDRLFFSGSLRRLSYPGGLRSQGPRTKFSLASQLQ